MKPDTKVPTSKELSTVSVNLTGLMVRAMLVNSSKMTFLERVSTLGAMVAVSMVTGQPTRCTVPESLSGQTAEYIKASSLMTGKRDKGCLRGPMDASLMVNG